MSEITRNDLGQAGVSACEEKGVKVYAVTTNIDGADRGGSAAVAGEQFHTDGGVYQVAVECGGGDRHGFVAAEHFWTVSLAVADARGDLNRADWSASTHSWRSRSERNARGENNVRNDFDYFFDSGAGGRFPALGTQPRLGLFSVGRLGIGAAGSGDPGDSGTNLEFSPR